MSSAFKVELLTPEGQVLKTQAEEVVLPAFNGEVGVLPGHGDFVGLLGFGVMKVKEETGTRAFFVDSGAYQVVNTVLSVLAIKAEPKAVLVEEDLQESLAQVEASMKAQEGLSPEDYNALKEECQKLNARLEVLDS